MKLPRARDANEVHQMPSHRIHVCGTIKIPMVRVSVIVRDCPEERNWCWRLREELRIKGFTSEIHAAAGMLAVYREDRPAVRKYSWRRNIPDTLAIHARTRRWVGGKENRHLAYVKTTAYPLAREYRCAICKRVFLLDEHGEEYVRTDERDDKMAIIYIHTGLNRHSKCCAQCLPLLRARLPLEPCAHLRTSDGDDSEIRVGSFAY